MRFHVVSLPHTNTTSEFSACAFTEKVRKFCKMMKNEGHTVFLYAGTENEAPCDELITCITEPTRAAFVAQFDHYSSASFDYSLPIWREFNTNAARAIKARHQEKDFICIIGGLAHKQIADEFNPGNSQVVEFGIGYGGTFARYRVWESYAWMHTCYGSAQPMNPCSVDGQFFDAVIPNYFEPELFPFSDQKDDYYLYIGRMIDRKGYRIASQICKKLGKKLILAGPGTPTEIDHGEFIGVVDPKTRGELMSKAKAVFVPTLYIEPFGGVAIEANLCGTPVITTDWGAFVETVQNGRNGYRCRNQIDFCWAVKQVDHLDYSEIANQARDRYSLDSIAPEYVRYFARLHTLWARAAGGNGWYADC